MACRALIAAACVFAMLLPTPAIAGSVSVIDDPRRERAEDPGELVLFQAAAGERNVVSATFETDPSGWLITDAGAPVTAGPSCQAIDAHTVRCHASADAYISDTRFELGDEDDRLRTGQPPDTVDVWGEFTGDGGAGDDRLIGGSAINRLEGGAGDDVLRASERGAMANVLNGGPGDDRLWGHGGFDELDGGGGGRDELYGRGGEDIMRDGDRPGDTGPDVFHGGSDGCCLILSGDRVSYRGRTEPIHVDLTRRGVAGEPGEGDVLIDVESVEGGSGDDRLLGDGNRNSLIGRPGRDRLVGRGGDDTLHPGPGGDRILCGPGDDTAGPPTSQDRLDEHCELLDAYPVLVYRLPAQPTQAMTYTVQCPADDEESLHLYTRCHGALSLREAAGRGRLLGTGGFPAGRWEARTFGVALTPLGARLASRPSGVQVRMRLHMRFRLGSESWSRSLRWNIRFRR